MSNPLGEPFEPIRPLKRSEYDRMVELGMFDDERLELLEGVLVTMSPQKASHASTVQKLNQMLMSLLAGRFALRIQAPLAVSDDSEPEPDVAVVLPGDYETDHPGTALLVIEVADTTLKRDRRKAGLYAAAGVPEYWIVNLKDRTVEVRTGPLGGEYAELHTARAGDVLRPLSVGEFELAVSAILPKA